MPEHSIYITKSDAEKIQSLIIDAQHGEYRGSKYLQMLSVELHRANLIDEKLIPPDVITMNSQVVLEDLESGEQMLYKLVFPEEADPIQGKISVLAPIGTAMLGYREGDVFEWETPDGNRKLQVKSVVYQPESSGE